MFISSELLLAAVCVSGLAWLIATRDLPWNVATAVVAIRIAVPVAFFGWFFDPSRSLIDEAQYFEHGGRLLAEGFTPWTALLDPQGVTALQDLSGGNHFLYSWWNLLAQYLMGEHHHAPVMLNVLLSFATGFVFTRLLVELGFERRYRTWALVFLLLHWDLLTWSSLVNVKGVLVQLLTVACLYLGVAFFRRRRLRHLAGFLVVSVAFMWLRFYIPFLLVAAAALFMFTQWSDPRKYLLLPLAAVAGFQAIPYLNRYGEYLDFEAVLYGAIRFLLTPLPWSIQDNYQFLLVSSVLHWLFIVPAIWGGRQLWRESPPARLLLLYGLTMLAFYALTEVLQGPRHRFQVSFLLAWLQFHCCWRWFVPVAARTHPLPVVRWA